MRISKSIILGALLCVTVLGACGAEVETSPSASPPQVTTPPSTANAPGAVQPPSPEAMLLKGNRSNKATALGRICWIEREVALASGALRDASLSLPGKPAPDETHASQAVERVKELVSAIPGEIGAADGLPPEVAPFRARLVSAVQELQPLVANVPAQAAAPERLELIDTLSRSLNFESFPGVKEFAEAAKADPESCPDI